MEFLIKVISETVGVVELVELMELVELVEMYLLKSYTKTPTSMTHAIRH